ncbi:MAG TPA: CaiB/BaiF CoA-transferase family protein [Acidimicrobiia bacterium]|jgi:crotonobetainyl-CoA:carnitine CoA-transferase CaiB-like acyl-CoA transferase
MAFLDDLRVVEVALLAPNMLGMHLADLGADVIKVEDPQRGDYTWRVGAATAGGLSFLHLRWNRGKRSLALDLRTAEGAALFRDLVGTCDVVIEGLRAGALERRGLGYTSLAAARPQLVFCSLSGFGQTGPYRDLATHGVAYDAYGGLAPPERTEDGFPTIPRRYLDVGTQAGALYAAVGVLAAVLHARATGEGAYLDVAQADAAAAWSAAGRIDPLLSGAAADDARPDMRESVRYQYYATADGRTILFQASERHFFERFCRAVGREDLATEGGAEFGEHAHGDVSLRRELAALFATRTQAEWVQLFIDADVPGAPVHTPPELIEDPQFVARAGVVEQHHPDAGRIRLLDSPIHADGRGPVRPAPRRGEHTDEVLEDLGVPAERVAALRAAGVVG